MEYVQAAEKRGIQVMIAGAGGAAHLGGVIASWTRLPVIGVPLISSDLSGIDALYSTVQMPPGVPIATVSIGKWGAKNAAMLALRILALKDSRIQQRLNDFHVEMSAKIAQFGIIHKESFEE
jgi:phosphoribosylaminoimidazole carboxylase PurE protein